MRSEIYSIFLLFLLCVGLSDASDIKSTVSDHPEESGFMEDIGFKNFFEDVGLEAASSNIFSQVVPAASNQFASVSSFNLPSFGNPIEQTKEQREAQKEQGFMPGNPFGASSNIASHIASPQSAAGSPSTFSEFKFPKAFHSDFGNFGPIGFGSDNSQKVEKGKGDLNSEKSEYKPRGRAASNFKPQFAQRRSDDFEFPKLHTASSKKNENSKKAKENCEVVHKDGMTCEICNDGHGGFSEHCSHSQNSGTDKKFTNTRRQTTDDVLRPEKKHVPAAQSKASQVQKKPSQGAAYHRPSQNQRVHSYDTPSTTTPRISRYNPHQHIRNQKSQVQQPHQTEQPKVVTNNYQTHHQRTQIQQPQQEQRHYLPHNQHQPTISAANPVHQPNHQSTHSQTNVQPHVQRHQPPQIQYQSNPPTTHVQSQPQYRQPQTGQAQRVIHQQPHQNQQQPHFVQQQPQQYQQTYHNPSHHRNRNTNRPLQVSNQEQTVPISNRQVPTPQTNPQTQRYQRAPQQNHHHQPTVLANNPAQNQPHQQRQYHVPQPQLLQGQYSQNVVHRNKNHPSSPVQSRILRKKQNFPVIQHPRRSNTPNQNIPKTSSGTESQRINDSPHSSVTHPRGSNQGLYQQQAYREHQPNSPNSSNNQDIPNLQLPNKNQEYNPQNSQPKQNQKVRQQNVPPVVSDKLPPHYDKFVTVSHNPQQPRSRSSSEQNNHQADSDNTDQLRNGKTKSKKYIPYASPHPNEIPTTNVKKDKQKIVKNATPNHEVPNERNHHHITEKNQPIKSNNDDKNDRANQKNNQNSKQSKADDHQGDGKSFDFDFDIDFRFGDSGSPFAQSKRRDHVYSLPDDPFADDEDVDHFAQVSDEPRDTSSSQQRKVSQKNKILSPHENYKELDKALTGFGKKKRNNCKQEVRKGMTCYICPNNHGQTDEECMYASHDPNNQHMMYTEESSYGNPDE